MTCMYVESSIYANLAYPEILPKDRKITQPSRVLTETVPQMIHHYIESNLERPRKQRLTAKQIRELLVTLPCSLLRGCAAAVSSLRHVINDAAFINIMFQ